MSQRRPSVLPIAALLVAACNPRAFDGVEPTQEVAHDADANPQQARDAGSTTGDANVDAMVDASPLDARAEDAEGPDLDAARDVEAGLTDAGDAGSISDPCIRPDPRIVVSKPAVELARLATSPLFENRVLGPTMRLRENDHVWAFRSVRRRESVAAAPMAAANHSYVAFDGPFQPWQGSSGSRPAWTLREPAPSSQLPPTLVPLRDGETVDSSLVPTSLLRLSGETRGRLFIMQYDVFTLSKVWLATLDDDAAQATRSAQPLFTGPPFFALGARVDGEFVTLYACAPAAEATPVRCVAGRVPASKIDQVGAYQVWAQDGSGKGTWSSDLQTGMTVLENVAGELSVGYNSYLQRFLAVYGEPSANHVVLRTAAQPQGPWSEPVRVPLPVPSALNNLNIREQPSLAQSCERRLVISYFAPTGQLGIFPTTGDTVLSAIDLD